MDINIPLTELDKQHILGGFPPIFYITNDVKKKREFNKNIESIKPIKFHNHNILNIKNILNKK